MGHDWPVWLYVPNVLGYIRICLLLLGWIKSVQNKCWGALSCFLTSIILDNLDGYCARVCEQVRTCLPG